MIKPQVSYYIYAVHENTRYNGYLIDFEPTLYEDDQSFSFEPYITSILDEDVEYWTSETKVREVIEIIKKYHTDYKFIIMKQTTTREFYN